MSLENLIREAMVEGGITALNIFNNGDGVFQANVGKRSVGAYKIIRHADPVKCITKAFEAGMKLQPKPTTSDQFEDLLG